MILEEVLTAFRQVGQIGLNSAKIHFPSKLHPPKNPVKISLGMKYSLYPDLCAGITVKYFIGRFRQTDYPVIRWANRGSGG